MQENQVFKNVSDKHTNVSRAALDAMRKQLARRSVYWKSVCDEVNAPVRQRQSMDIFRLPETEVVSFLLTPTQADGLEKVQRLCEGIGKLQQQINMVLITHELDLPKLQLVELSYLLLKSDRMIGNAKCAASRLGVAAVQPKVKRDFLDKFLGLVGFANGKDKGRRAETVRA